VSCCAAVSEADLRFVALPIVDHNFDFDGYVRSASRRYDGCCDRSGGKGPLTPSTTPQGIVHILSSKHGFSMPHLLLIICYASDFKNGLATQKIFGISRVQIYSLHTSCNHIYKLYRYY
jgi:hypothetical protein